MSRERALLRRLVEWYEMPFGRGGYEDFCALVADIRARLAEPEGDGDIEALVEKVQNLRSMTGWVLARESDALCEEIVSEIRSLHRPTPRSRAEGSDLSVDQGREFRVVDGLGDSNRAGKVTIDPTLLSPPTPRSRAEAEAMLKLYDVRVETNRRYADEYSEKEMVAQRAALLAALTGGGG